MLRCERNRKRGLRMRLIDADKVINMLKETGIIQDNDLGQCVIAEINRIPTAYDVDKVLEQLEDKVKEYDERIEKRKGANFFDETERIKQFDERAWGIEIAIEIVKAGGTND